MSSIVKLAFVAVVVVLAASSSACLFDEVTGIPCGADDECPTTYFCDLPSSTCHAKTDVDGVPNLAIPKVKDGTGQLVLLPKVPASATTPLGLQIVNVGDGPADDIGISFAALACASFEIHDDTVPATLAKGASALVTIDATTQGGNCASVKIVDWFLSFSGREGRGTFDLDIGGTPAPPGPGGD
jgi:hypothetical protein